MNAFNRLFKALGWMISRGILTIVFYLVVIPLGYIVRRFGGDPMQRDFDAATKSYFLASKERDQRHMRRPY